jgi:hypothetical protein
MRHLRLARSHVTRVAALGATGLFGLAATTAAAEDPYQGSVVVNGKVKAHALYYPTGDSVCINLLNAPAAGAHAWVNIVAGPQTRWLGSVTDDTNDGYRVCTGLPHDLAKPFEGQQGRMDINFCPGAGACRTVSVGGITI